MSVRELPTQVTSGLALGLGHASVLWGSGVALSYLMGFILLTAQPMPGFGLSALVPTIGLGMACASATLGWWAEGAPGRSAVVGIGLNLLGVALSYLLAALLPMT